MSIITDAQLVQFLANDYNVREISKKINVNVRTLDSRLAIIKQRLGVKTYTAVVAHYFDKQLIKLCPNA